jgi:hypothetical protein
MLQPITFEQKQKPKLQGLHETGGYSDRVIVAGVLEMV